MEVYPDLFYRHSVGDWANVVRDSYGEFSDATFADRLDDRFTWLFYHLLGWFFES